MPTSSYLYWCSAMINVVIFDEHEIFRAGLRAVFERTSDVRVAGETHRAQDALRMIESAHADLLIIDLSSIGKGGIDFIRQSKRRRPELLILVLTAQVGVDLAIRALRAGASGYLTKFASCNQTLEAVRKVSGGRVHVCEDVAEQLMSQLFDRNGDGGHKALTAREFEIFIRIARGETCMQIARTLMLSAKTVSTHKTRFMAKMNMSSTSDVVQYAVAHKLIDSYVT
jgi:DNA-binding NarL/FixJ family response regulator